MHRGTTSIYRRVTMAASSGTKNMPYCCNGQTRRSLLAKKRLLVCSSQDVFAAYIPFCLAPTDSSLEGNAAPLLVPGHRFLWCILHPQNAFVKVFLQKNQNYFFHKLLYRNNKIPALSKISLETSPLCEKGATKRDDASVFVRFFDL